MIIRRIKRGIQKIVCPGTYPKSLYFLHIPKTGGSSLAAHLRRHYFPRHWQTFHLLYQLAEAPREVVHSKPCYHGHFGRLFFHYYRKKVDSVITILRDPFEQTVSLIHMAHKFYLGGQLVPYGDDELNRLMAADNYLEAVLFDPYYSDMFTHSAIKHLGYMASPEEVQSHPPIRRNILPMAADPTQAQYSLYLAQAKKTLDAIDFVLITEFFDESLELLNDYLGINTHTLVPYLNVGHQKKERKASYRDTLPPALVQRIDALTAYDQELYAYAKQKFQAAVSQAKSWKF